MNIKEIREKTFKKENTFYHVFITEPLTLPALWIVQNMRYITPNGLSIAGLFMTIGTAWLFLQGNLIGGAVLYFVSYFTDSLDGKVARLRDISSPLGGYLDGVIDTFRPFLLTLGLGLWTYELLGVEALLVGFTYVTFVLAYQVSTATAYNLNKNKQVMNILMEEKPSSLMIKAKKWLQKYRLRLGYTTAETNAIVFLIGPVIAFITGINAIVLWGYVFGSVMILLLLSIFLFVQFRQLAK